eukprot:scaffold14646_cov77-Skeletonema_dohrnii-CCMP3373.AAC.4
MAVDCFNDTIRFTIRYDIVLELAQEAVDCDSHSVGYDMVLESCSRRSQIGPHQVTYDVVATPTRQTNA